MREDAMGTPIEKSVDVLFIVPRFHTNLLGWLEGLKSLNISFEILVQTIGKSEDHGFYSPIKIDPKVDFFKVSIRNPRGCARISPLTEILRNANPKLIIFRFELNWTAFIFLIQILRTRIPFVIYIQWPLVDLTLSRRIIRSLLSRTLRVPIITPVLSKSNSWIGLNSVKKVSVDKFFVPFGMPLRLSHPQNSNQDINVNELKFLTIGKFQHRKNHLDTVKYLLSNYKFCNSEATLEIIGEASTSEHFKLLKELKDFISSNNLGKKISVSTNLSHPEVLSKIEDCDVFLMLSHDEPASISNIEAMSFGKPLILKSGNGTANYMSNGRGGFIVNTQEEFNFGVNFFFDNPEYISFCKSENLDATQRYLDPKKTALQILKIARFWEI